MTFEQLRVQADNRKLVRKIQKAVGCLAPTSVPLPTSLYDETGELLNLKQLGWHFIGLVTPDGYTFGREIEKDDIDALGYASPIRSDVTRVPRTVAVTPLQSGQRHMEELLKGVDLSSAVQDPVTGEVVFDEPDLPVNREYRFLVIGQDGPADEEWIMGKGFPTVKLASSGDETWGQEGAKSTEITLDVLTDDENGTPVRHFMAGTGALKYKDVLGYGPQPTTWVATTAYLVGDRVTLSGGALLEATVAGTTGSTEPAAPAVDGTVTDGTVTWKRIS